MTYLGLPIHEYWRKLARLIVEEQDEANQKEWLDQLVLSYQKEILRLMPYGAFGKGLGGDSRKLQ